MDKKNKINRFDGLVEALVNEFIKIPNFDLLSNDPIANRVFNQISFRLAEISSYTELVTNHFIPATNKAIVMSKEDIARSKYRFLLKSSDLNFSETLDDTIRLAYVGLFHKIESFVNEILQIADLIYNDGKSSKETVYHYAKKKFGLDFKDWQNFAPFFKINWICNCVKHKDGYPLKMPKPSIFEYVAMDRRLKISAIEFKSDCDTLLKFYPAFLQIVFTMSSVKFYTDSEKDFDAAEFPELHESGQKAILEMETKIKSVLEKLDELKRSFIVYV